MYTNEHRRCKQFYHNEARKAEQFPKCSKGEIIVSHALALALTVLFIVSIVFVFNNFRTQQSAQLADVQLQSLCLRIKGAAEAMWHPTSYQTIGNATMGRVVLSLPFRAGGASYSVALSQNEISLEAPDIPASAKCYSSVAGLSGSASGGIAELAWIREGTQDRIELR
jgi:hypothetical protein